MQIGVFCFQHKKYPRPVYFRSTFRQSAQPPESSDTLTACAPLHRHRTTKSKRPCADCPLLTLATMNDNVFWATENQVMAAARIEAILYEDIVQKGQGIIVPFMVESFLHCRPFSFDSLQQYAKEMLDYDEDIGEINVPQEAPAEPVRCATAIPFEIGFAMLSYIDDDYHAQDEANQA